MAHKILTLSLFHPEMAADFRSGVWGDSGLAKHEAIASCLDAKGRLKEDKVGARIQKRARVWCRSRGSWGRSARCRCSCGRRYCSPRYTTKARVRTDDDQARIGMEPRGWAARGRGRSNSVGRGGAVSDSSNEARRRLRDSRRSSRHEALDHAASQPTS